MPDTDPTAPDAAPFGLEFGNQNPQLARTYQAGENLRAGLNTAGDAVIDAATAGPMALGRLASGQGSWADVGDAMMSFLPELKGAAFLAPLGVRLGERAATPIVEAAARYAPTEAGRALGFDTVAYHATGRDFNEFKPSPYRQATFFAATPEGATRGASAGAGDLTGSGTGAVIPVHLRSQDVFGLTPTPSEQAWWKTLPDNATEQQVNAAMKDNPSNFSHWWQVYDEIEHPNGTFEYVKRPIPQISYQHAAETRKNVYGDEIPHWGTQTNEARVVQRARNAGMSAFLQQDESGVSIGHGDPTPDKVRSVFAADQNVPSAPLAERIAQSAISKYPDSESIHMVDVGALDKLWSKNKNLYVPPTGSKSDSAPTNEYVVGAASRLGDKIGTGPIHSDSMRDLAAKSNYKDFDRFYDEHGNDVEQGFITSNGNFLSRRDAVQLFGTGEAINLGLPTRMPQSGGSESSFKLDRAKQFLSELGDNEPWHAPILGVGKNTLGFEDGRHRFAAMRDLGMTSAPVAMDEQSAAWAKARGLLMDTERASGGRVPHLADGGTPSANPFDAFDAAPSANPFDQFDAAPTSPTPAPAAAEPQGIVAGALHPITSYPSTYAEMNREAVAQMGRGVGQLSSPSGAMDVAKGLGNVALGGASYVTSPINAALRTVVGEPIEKNFGVPKQYSEFAAGLALPGVGFTRVLPAAEAAVSPTAAALRAAADAAYKAPEVAALKLHPQTMALFGQETAASLERGGYDPLLAPKTFGLLDKTGNVPEGTPFVTAQNFDTLRRQLGKAAESTDRTERKAATLAKNKLDDFMANIPQNAVLEGDPQAASETLQVARGNYAALMRAQQFDSALDAAERQAARAGVGGNWENATRQQISRILNSPAKIRGYSPDERQALEDYVAGNFTRNSLRVATKVMGGDNPLMAAIHAGLAWPTWGLSLAAPLTGYALKRINNALSQRDLDALGEMLRSRSPLGDEMRAGLSGWARTGGAMFQSPTTQNATRFAAASQLLASKMRDAGFSPDPHQLMNPFGTDFKGTLPAGAQEQGQEPNKRFGGEVGYQREGYKSGGATQHLGEQRKHGGKVLSRRERVKTVLARHGVGM